MAKILVIDDDDQLLTMMAAILQRHGHEAVLESDPEQGLLRVIKEQPDVLVLDVMMPRINGHDLCRQIRQTHQVAGLPILMLTARAQPIDRLTALESGADDYMSKPVVAQELMRHVDDLLAKASAERPEKPATSISFFGLRGGIGRTTIAVNLAAALNAARPGSTCLLDLSPAVSQAVMHFHLQQEKSWLDLQAVENLDWPAVQDYLLTTADGLYILSGPDFPQGTQQLSARFFSRLLVLLQKQLQFLVLDLPPLMSPAVKTALRLSDMVFHIVNPDIISVKTAIQSHRAIARQDELPAHYAYLLNQARPDVQLSSTTVEKGLQARLGFKIGYDKNQHQALAKGSPLVLSTAESPLANGLRQLAKVIWERAQA